jgi:WD40 repeat protein
MKRVIVVVVAVSIALAASTKAQQPAANVKAKATPVRCLAFSRDGRSLAVAYNGSEALIVWDIAKRKPVYSAREKAPIRCVVYSPVADLLAISAGSATKLLDPKIDRVVRELDGNQGPVRDVGFSPDGRQLVTAGGDRTVKLWDLATGEVVQTFTGPKGSVIGAAISPDGKWLAAGCGNADGVYIWRLEQPMAKPRKIDFPPRRDYPGSAGRPADMPRVTFSPDSRLFAAADWDQGSISIIDVASGKTAFTFTSMNGWKSVAISPDGKWLAAAPNYDRAIRLVRFEQSASEEQDRQIATMIETFHDDNYANREAASEQLAALGPMTIEQLRAHLDSPDAEMRVRCRRLMERILDLAKAKKLEGHAAEAAWVAFSPDSKLLASGDAEGIVKLWSIPDGREVATLMPDGTSTEPPREPRVN